MSRRAGAGTCCIIWSRAGPGAVLTFQGEVAPSRQVAWGHVLGRHPLEAGCHLLGMQPSAVDDCLGPDGDLAALGALKAQFLGARACQHGTSLALGIAL